MRKLLALTAVLVGALALGLAPAGAITNGTPDGEGHRYVGLMVAKNAAGVPLWRCSGTLMSATVFMVAGHCTEAPAASIAVWFSSGSPNGIPLGAGFPAAGPNQCSGITGYPCTGDASGTPFTHPDYDPNAFFLHDLGVVELGAPIDRGGFGALPEEGELSDLPKHAEMTAVGYGLQKSFPDAAAWRDQAVRIRMVARPRIMKIDTGFVADFAFETSFGANRGGTCFGDSGGPDLLAGTDTVIAVNSYVTNTNCTGVGYSSRIDRADTL